MAEGIYMGGEAIKGKASKEIRDLASEIEAQQEKFATQSGKAKLWNMFGDALQLGSMFIPGFGIPAKIAIGGITDFLVDQISGRTLMKDTKAGDPEAIKKLQTAFTGGGYGKEFGKMIKESKPDFWAGLLQEGIEGGKTYLGGEAVDKLGGSDWFSKMFMKGTPVSGGDTMFMAREGGYVPKYYGGGSVQGGTPTIAGYFSEQGKTLGGSNKQSVAEMLGRK